MVGLTLGSLVFAFLWSGLAGDLNEPHTAGNDSFSSSALGHRAFAELLSRSGITVKRRRSHRIGALGDSTALVLAEPKREREGGLDAEEFRALTMAAVDRHFPIVIVLPKRVGGEDENHPGWIGAAEVMHPDSVLALMRRFMPLRDLTIKRRGQYSGACSTSWGERLAVSLSPAQFITGRLTPVVTCDAGVLVGRMRFSTTDGDSTSGSEIYLVSDPDLVNTVGLGSAENAGVVSGLLLSRLHARTVWFDETLHHPVLSMSLATEMLRYPLVLALVQSLLLLGFIIAASVTRFGKARETRPPDESKRALVNSIAGLLSATGRPAETLGAYLSQSLRDTAERYGLPADLRLEEAATRLAKIARSRGVHRDISHLSYLVDGLKQSSERQSQAVLRVAQEIHRWHGDMNHDR